MTKTFNASVIALIAAAAILFSFAYVVHANPLFISPKAQSATASSTQTYLRAGVATSTTIYDSYEQYGTNETNSGNLQVPTSVAFALDGVASGTLSVINATCEFSDNYVGTTGNGDWYQNELLAPTSTAAQNIQNPLSYTFAYASSTVGGAGLSGINTRFQKLVQCPILTRYVRLIVSNTGANASVWVQALPLKQRNSN